MLAIDCNFNNDFTFFEMKEDNKLEFYYKNRKYSRKCSAKNYKMFFKLNYKLYCVSSGRVWDRRKEFSNK